MSCLRISTNNLIHSTKISTTTTRAYYPYHSAQIREERHRMVPFLRSPLRQIRPLLQDTLGLLRPDRTSSEKNVA